MIILSRLRLEGRQSNYGAFLIMGFCLVFVSTILSCGTPLESDQQASDDTLLEVNSKPYSQQEFQFFLVQNYPELEGTQDADLLSHAFDAFKKEIILAELANFSGHFVSDDQIDNFIENKMTTTSFHLKGSQERQFWKSIIRRRLAIQELLKNDILKKAVVTDQAIQIYYQNHQQEYQGETLYQLRIVQTGTLEKAEDMLEVLKKSREPFLKVSSDFAENDGYRIVQDFPLEGLITPFQKVLRNLSPGQYSGPIPVKQGEVTVYYVIYLEAILPPKTISYEEAHYDIQAKLKKVEAENILDAKLEQFMARLPVKHFPNHFPFAYIEPTKRSQSQ